MNLSELIEACEDEIIEYLSEAQKESIKNVGWGQFYSGIHSFISKYIDNPNFYKLDENDKTVKCSTDEGFKMFMLNNYGLIFSTRQAKILTDILKKV